ncbi:MAG: hypothetical protein BWZ08_01436 [candidate division BRC1 bacterium ADurb.BinA292]|nr:MAG: hypothetical protein BWZ08_01436 [candidate division BRC1 bacterium ADurb.BinA292]
MEHRNRPFEVRRAGQVQQSVAVQIARLEFLHAVRRHLAVDQVARRVVGHAIAVALEQDDAVLGRRRRHDIQDAVARQVDGQHVRDVGQVAANELARKQRHAGRFVIGSTAVRVRNQAVLNEPVDRLIEIRGHIDLGIRPVALIGNVQRDRAVQIVGDDILPEVDRRSIERVIVAIGPADVDQHGKLVILYRDRGDIREDIVKLPRQIGCPARREEIELRAFDVVESGDVEENPAVPQRIRRRRRFIHPGLGTKRQVALQQRGPTVARDENIHVAIEIEVRHADVARRVGDRTGDRQEAHGIEDILQTHLVLFEVLFPVIQVVVDFGQIVRVDEIDDAVPVDVAQGQPDRTAALGEGLGLKLGRIAAAVEMNRDDAGIGPGRDQIEPAVVVQIDDLDVLHAQGIRRDVRLVELEVRLAVGRQEHVEPRGIRRAIPFKAHVGRKVLLAAVDRNLLVAVRRFGIRRRRRDVD